MEQPHRINGQVHHSLLEICQTNVKKPSTTRTTAPITKPNGHQTTDPSEKSKILLEQFCPTEREDRKDDRTKLYEQTIQDAMQNKESHPLNTPISITELEINLTGLPNKAMGRDRIHNEMLKNLNQNNRTTLLKPLNISLNTGYLPLD
ncbi:hypothetical protein DAPPUDRAFT_320370 [Daphnia pulex]|uniref:Uncharacterized protein n=1 Tax=Daphnia pulex TaxID=6669 RepID=E9GPN7_DAPPU|nr:hypothetical protein DAPPUDRAFT_320370 [Daphnia pulex]|eukprot:EFX78414.1 hypothetical protein DAPPUDRAFT_320370 [Daphnia pulex]